MATSLAFVVILLAQDEPAQYPSPVICLYNSPQQFRLVRVDKMPYPCPLCQQAPLTL